MGARRYSPEELQILTDMVNKELNENGAPSVTAACTKICSQFNELAMRDCKPLALVSLYQKQKNLQVASARGRQLAPGAVVMLKHKSDSICTMHPSIEEALKNVNGKVEDFEFYEAVQLNVQYKTIVVVS